MKTPPVQLKPSSPWLRVFAEGAVIVGWLGTLAGCGGGTASLETLEITTTSLPQAEVFRAYDEALGAVGGDGHYTWSVIQNSLPTDLSLEPSTGRISGTATGSGRTFTVQVLSGDGQAAQRPMTIEFRSQVIEEVQFDASLDIDLAQMTKLASGVYRTDLVIGTGATLLDGMTANVGYTGWLTSGTQFDSGEFSFTTGTNRTIPGFEEGLMGQRVGGTRLIIIPPALGYGATGVEGTIPGGAILVFHVELLSVS